MDTRTRLTSLLLRLRNNNLTKHDLFPIQIPKSVLGLRERGWGSGSVLSKYARSIESRFVSSVSLYSKPYSNTEALDERVQN